MGSSFAIDIPSDASAEHQWLYSKTWDLTFISLSAGLVCLPFFSYEFFTYIFSFTHIRQYFHVNPEDVLDVSRNTVNGMIALLIGGPHMYATYTRTFFDGKFRREHRSLIFSSLIIPPCVILLGIFQFQILITLFFMWASLHILQQANYIVGCYNTKVSKKETSYNNFLDLIVLSSSLFPVAVWRMIHGNFKIGQINLLIPNFIQVDQNPFLGYLGFIVITVIFASSFTLWFMKSYQEYKSGRLHKPKFLFILLTATIAFLIPTYHELDVAFQGFNTWHSFQYLGLTWFINAMRKKKDGIIENKVIDNISTEGKGWKYYLFNVSLAICTIGAIAIILATRNLTGFTFDQAYYIVILSFLLMHYYQDQYLFKDKTAIF